LLFDDSHAHFDPSADTLDHEYLKYTRQLTWGDPMAFSQISRARALRDLQLFDQVWGNGIMPALCQKLGRKLDVFVPYGSDLSGLTSFPAIPLRRQRLASFFEVPFRQRQGIRSHVRILAMDRAPHFDSKVARLGFQGKRVYESVPLLYLPQYDNTNAGNVGPASFWTPLLQKARARAKHLIFHHARHVWRAGADPNSRKGNDALIRAFATFVKAKPGRAHLVTTEYGPDAPHSRELCEALGVADNVTWLPVLQRREVMACLAQCDLTTGDFEVGWLTGGVVFEGLASGRPLLHYRDESELNASERASLPPMIVARTEQEILSALEDFERRPEHFKAIGAKGQAWLHEQSGKRQVAVIARAAGVSVRES
jgi:hypothetical protein